MDTQKNVVLNFGVFLLGMTLSLSCVAGELSDVLRDVLQHPSVKATTDQVNAAQAQKDAATGRYFGSALLSTRWHQYEGQRIVGVFTPGVPGVPLTSDKINQTGLTYSLPVDVFGVIAANRERAKHDLVAAELLARQQTLLKLHQASSAYITLQALLKQREALVLYRQRVTATHQRILKEVELGKTAGVNARYAESEVARLVADEAILNGSIVQAQADLAEASSRDKFLPATAEIHIPAWEDVSATTTLPVQIAQAHRKAVDAQADESHRALYPMFSLDANYFRNSGASGEYRDTWALGIIINLPLGVSQYQRSQAQRFNAEAASEQSEAIGRDSERQLAILHASYDAAMADAQAMEKEVAYLEQVAAVQREMQRLGSQTLENLFTHERDLLNARARQAQDQARAVMAWSEAEVLNGLSPETYITRIDAK